MDPSLTILSRHQANRFQVSCLFLEERKIMQRDNVEIK